MRLGFIGPGPGIEAAEEAFRQRLRDLGHVEGRNLSIEWRFAKGDVSRFVPFAQELIGMPVDCLVAVGIDAAVAARQTSTSIPIVLGNADDDPVRRGLVASLGRPGGNVTGAISVSWELAGKRVEILKDALPKLTRVALLLDNSTQTVAGHVRNTEEGARKLGVTVLKLPIGREMTVERQIASAVAQRAEAAIVLVVGSIIGMRSQIVGEALKRRLPLMATHAAFAAEGALMSYAADITEERRTAAEYVDRIYKGAKPADLPIDQPKRYELVLNKRTVEALGLKLSQTLLARVDRVVG